MSKTRVFVDTNVILESFRVNCWTAICHNYAIETVEKCIEESLTGNSSNPRHIHVDRNVLVNGLANSHKISKRDIAKLVLDFPTCQGLDDGESHLFAWLYANGHHPEVLISTADKAAIVATSQLGWIDSTISLEKLIQQSGVSRQQFDKLAQHYRADWLSNIKLKIQLGVIP